MDEDEIIWRDKSGKSYRMQDIENSHLLNIIKYLAKKVDECFDVWATVPEEIERLMWGEAQNLEDYLEIFKKEAKKRKLIGKRS